MSRVLITGGAGALGAAVVRRLLGDPAYEVRVSDRRPAPQWMREGCEMHTGDLRVPAQALLAMKGCTHVIHAAAVGGAHAKLQRQPHTLIEANNALDSAVVNAALELDVQRLLYVSSAAVFDRAELFPTPEDYLPLCPTPLGAYGYSKLTGERRCRAGGDEHGLPYTICRPFGAYGGGEVAGVEPGIAHVVPDLIEQALAGRKPLQIRGSGEQSRTLTHVDDMARGLIAAMGSAAGLNEDFNIGGSRELTIAEVARIVWEACGQDADALKMKRLPSFADDVQRRAPSVEKARELLGWEGLIEFEDGIAEAVASSRRHSAALEAPTLAAR